MGLFHTILTILGGMIAGIGAYVTNHPTSPYLVGIGTFIAFSGVILSIQHHFHQKKYIALLEQKVKDFPESKSQTAMPPKEIPVLQVPVSVPPKLPETEKQLERKKEERVFIDKPVEYFTKFYESRNNVQADRMMEVYKGNWMKVSGFFSNANILEFQPQEAQVFINITKEFDTPRVAAMSANAKFVKAVEAYNSGDKITVLGKIKSASANWLDLKDCEILPE